MQTYGEVRNKLIRIAAILAILLSMVPFANLSASAQVPSAYFREVRTFSTGDYGIFEPAQVLFSPEKKSLLIIKASSIQKDASITYSGIAVNLQRDFEGNLSLQANNFNPINASFNPKDGNLFYIDQVTSELNQIARQGADSFQFQEQRPNALSIASLQVNNPQGITFDPETGDLFILDARRMQIVKVPSSSFNQIESDAGLLETNSSVISLQAINNPQLQGIAFNPNNKHLYIGSSSQNAIYELSETGQLIS